jgi:hypothetical protein
MNLNLDKKIIFGFRMPVELHDQITKLAAYHKTNRTKIVLAMLNEQVRIENETIKKTA